MLQNLYYLKEGTLLRNNSYRILSVLGQGGFGITYLAIHTQLNKKVAIKEFFPKTFCDREEDSSHIRTASNANTVTVEKLKNKFIKEAEHIAKMDSPYIVRIIDVFSENNTAYYIMDYIDGMSLSDMVKKNGPLPQATAIDYATKVGEALDYIHSKRINHLDVKPANIMIRAIDNSPVLVDFGLSKQYDSEGNQTSTTPVGISHGFAPIEQYRDGGVKEFSPQTDLYSLAATLYYLLSGKIPPQASVLVEDDLSFPPEFPQSLKNPIGKAMSTSRKRRHESIQEFVREINNADITSTTTLNHTIAQNTSDVTIFTNYEKNENVEEHNNIMLDSPYEFEQEEIDETEKPFYKKIGFYIGIGVFCVIVFVIYWIYPSSNSSEAYMADDNFESIDSAFVENKIVNTEEEGMDDGEMGNDLSLSSLEKEPSPIEHVHDNQVSEVEDYQDMKNDNVTIPKNNEVSLQYTEDEKIYQTVEQTAEFPGGLQALMNWLSQKIHYPEEAQENDIQGRVVVKFVVNKDGTISDVSILKSVHPSLDMEALRVVRQMPRWTPAKNNGHPVSSYFSLPINFRLSQE